MFDANSVNNAVSSALDAQKIGLKSYNLGGWEYKVNADLGYYPRFSNEIRGRINKKKATNVIVTGEGGVGKTYIAMQICKMLNPRFTVDQVVFNYADFMRAVIYTPMGVPIVFDEPSYAMGKREWFKQLNQALVKTIESFRFKVHPLFIPVINKALLDKTIRSYLLQYQVYVRDRGRAIVYRMNPSQHQDKVYINSLTELDYGMQDNNLCSMPTCLGCEYVSPKDPAMRCQIFRAQYERKKANTQEDRYEQALDEAETKEIENLTINQLETIAMTYLDDILNDDGTISQPKLKVVLFRKEGIKIGHNKSYDLKALMEYDLAQKTET